MRQPKPIAGVVAAFCIAGGLACTTAAGSNGVNTPGEAEVVRRAVEDVFALIR